MSAHFDLRMVKLNPRAEMLRRGSDDAAGFDVSYCGVEPIRMLPGEIVKIPTGWAFAMPPGICMQVLPRSGTAIKQRLRPMNTPGLIDPDYRGELFVALVYDAPDINAMVTIEPGQKIAQLLFTRYYSPRFQVVGELDETDRGEAGFGSTGDH